MTSTEGLQRLDVALAETFAGMAAIARARVEKDEARLEKSRINEDLVLHGIRAALWGGPR